MKLTRRQELALIDMGLKVLLEQLEENRPIKKEKSKKKSKGNPGYKWTTAQRKAQAERMRNKWKSFKERKLKTPA